MGTKSARCVGARRSAFRCSAFQPVQFTLSHARRPTPWCAPACKRACSVGETLGFAPPCRPALACKLCQRPARVLPCCSPAAAVRQTLLTSKHWRCAGLVPQTSICSLCRRSPCRAAPPAHRARPTHAHRLPHADASASAHSRRTSRSRSSAFWGRSRSRTAPSRSGSACARATPSGAFCAAVRASVLSSAVALGVLRAA